MPATPSSTAAACVVAPSLIWPMAVRISVLERLISWIADDSSSAAAATSSALLAMSVEFFSSSDSVSSSLAARSASASAWACCSTDLRASSAAEDCSSAAAATSSAPFCAWPAAVCISSAAFSISFAPSMMTAMSSFTWPSCWVTTLPFSASARASSADVFTPSEIFCAPSWICLIRPSMLVAFFSEASARVRTVSATTAKPLPCLPARAASMAAFSASRLVWSAMRMTWLTASMILCACCSSCAIILTDSVWRSEAALTLSTSRPTLALVVSTTDCSVSVLRREASAASCWTLTREAICAIAVVLSSLAEAACSAPFEICTMALPSSSAADDACVTPLASCVAAEAMRSAACCWRASVRACCRF